jgi:hypothetical protein
MEPIDPQALTAVRGGIGPLLGAFLQAAPGLLNGLIGSLTSGRGTATASAQPQPQPQPQPTLATPPAATGAPGPQMQTASADPTGGACRSCCDSVTNIIRIG